MYVSNWTKLVNRLKSLILNRFFIVKVPSDIYSLRESQIRWPFPDRSRGYREINDLKKSANIIMYFCNLWRLKRGLLEWFLMPKYEKLFFRILMADISPFLYIFRGSFSMVQNCFHDFWASILMDVVTLVLILVGPYAHTHTHPHTQIHNHIHTHKDYTHRERERERKRERKKREWKWEK